jgi:adenosyl cobinamide kinase/adenosyl cobinamide phosphate guanylyltransferase
MAEPLSKQTFEIFVGEHQKYLDSKFNQLSGSVDDVQTSVDRIKQTREKDWKEHAEEHEAEEACQLVRFKRTHKFLLVGCIGAIILGAALAPSLGWVHVLGFVTKLLTGTVPIGM